MKEEWTKHKENTREGKCLLLLLLLRGGGGGDKVEMNYIFNIGNSQNNII